jgi:aromatic-L-amino-acid/L-tryptophan decarboxylase
VVGATNTGSIDAVGELADVAQREDLWLHVDAAYGAAARLSAREAGLVNDLERADSVTVDPHKWFFQGYDIGGIVVRNGAHLEQAFGGSTPEYYRGGEGRPVSSDRRESADDDRNDSDGHGDAGQLNFWKLGVEGSRRWRALKLWLSWKHVGTLGFGRLVEANIDLARHLARRIAETDDFEALPAHPPLSVVCFRHHPSGGSRPEDPAALDEHQDRVQRALEASGEAWLTTTRLRGGTWLRAGIMNTQATEADIDALLEIVRRVARA